MECYATLCKYLNVLFFHMLAIMEAFFYVSLMLRHVNKGRGREERRMQEKGGVSLATGTLLLRAQVASCLKDCLTKHAGKYETKPRISVAR